MKRVLVKNTKDNVATRANDLVQGKMKPTIHNLEHTTVNDRRFLLWVISCVQPQDTELKEYELPLKEFAELSGISPANIYAEARKICKRVMALVVELEGFDESGFDESVMFNLIHKATHKKSTGTAIVKIHEDMAPFLLDQKENFTQIKIAHYMPLRSTYSQLLYEQIKVIDWRTNKAKYTLEELRDVLDVKEGTYQKRFSVFEQKVIKKAVEEITEKTDIKVTYEKIKRGRKIHEIEFTFVNKPEEVNTAMEVSPVNNDLEEELLSYGLDPKLAREYAEKRAESAKNALQSLKKQKTVKNKAGWIRTFIEKNFEDPEIADKKRLKEANLKRQKNEILVREAKEREKKEREQYWVYVKQTIRDVIESLAKEDSDSLLKEFKRVRPPLLQVTKKKVGVEYWVATENISSASKFLVDKTGVKIKSQEEYSNK